MPTLSHAHTPGKAEIVDGMRVDKRLLAQMRRAGEKLRAAGIRDHNAVNALVNGDLQHALGSDAGDRRIKLVRYACRNLNGPVLEALFPTGTLTLLTPDGVRTLMPPKEAPMQTATIDPERAAAFAERTITLRACTACGEKKAATDENFSKDSNAPQGLRRVCKKCDNARRRGHDEFAKNGDVTSLPPEQRVADSFTKPETKVCVACKQEKPVEDFPRNRQSRLSMCGPCSGVRKHGKRNRVPTVDMSPKQANVVAALIEPVPPHLRTYSQDEIADAIRLEEMTVEDVRSTEEHTPTDPIGDAVAVARLVIEADEKVTIVANELGDAQAVVVEWEKQLSAALAEREQAIQMMRGGA